MPPYLATGLAMHMHMPHQHVAQIGDSLGGGYGELICQAPSAVSYEDLYCTGRSFQTMPK